MGRREDGSTVSWSRMVRAIRERSRKRQPWRCKPFYAWKWDDDPFVVKRGRCVERVPISRAPCILNLGPSDIKKEAAA